MTDVETISTSHPITKNQLGGLDSHKMNPILYFVTLPPLFWVVSPKRDMLKS